MNPFCCTGMAVLGVRTAVEEAKDKAFPCSPPATIAPEPPMVALVPAPRELPFVTVEPETLSKE